MTSIFKGLGATVQIGSDSYPYTVVKVSKNESKITLQRDKSFRKDNNGVSESQDYLFVIDQSGEIENAFKRKDGYYLKNSNCKVTLGIRKRHNDPSF